MRNHSITGESTNQSLCKTSGYHVYFGLSSTSLGNDTEFEVKEDIQSTDKKAFNKSLKNKKMNKKILGEFIELVA